MWKKNLRGKYEIYAKLLRVFFFQGQKGKCSKLRLRKERVKLGAARLKYYSRLLKISCMMNVPQNAA